MASDNTQNSDIFGDWNERSAIEITPTTDSLDPIQVVRHLKRCHSVLDEEILEWQLILDGGGCTYRISAPPRVLDDIHPILREALAGYALRRVEIMEPLPIDEASLCGVEFEGHGARKNDWQTGLRPLITDTTPAHNAPAHNAPARDTKPAFTSLVNSLAETEATVVYQALLTARDDWTHLADDRRYQLKHNLDTVAMRLGNFLFPPDPEADIEPYEGHEDRIERITSMDTRCSFTVAARAIAWGPESDHALKSLTSALNTSRGKYYEPVGVHSDQPLQLAERMGARTIPTCTMLMRLFIWLLGSSVRPTLVADARSLAHFCTIDGGQLTSNGRRRIAATPPERTGLPQPAENILDQYKSGFPLGTALSSDGEPTQQIALPPSMQSRHILILGKSGAGKTIFGESGMLNNQPRQSDATDGRSPRQLGASIIIDGKGDGMPQEYLQAHYAKHGTLDGVYYFKCAEILPAVSFFDIEPALSSNIPREQAVEDIADHYIEILEIIMGTERFHQAVKSPSAIRYLIKALFDPVHGGDAFSHDALEKAAVDMKATEDAPPVSDENLKRMLGSITSDTTQTIEMVMGGAETRINKIPEDSRLKKLFTHVPEEGDAQFAFSDVLDDENATIIFDTSGFRSRSQRALTLVLLSKLWTALKHRATNQMGDNPIVSLYIEEAADVASTRLMTDLLSKGRGFDLSVVLSMQFPKQVRAASTRGYAELLNNISTLISGNVAVDADLATRFATSDMSATEAGNRLRSLKRGEWLASLPSEFGVPEPRPFTLQSPSLPDGHPESDRPLTPAMQAGFDGLFDLLREDTLDQYGIDITDTERASAAPSSEPTVTPDHAHVLEYTKRFPEGIEYDATAEVIVCSHCETRYKTSLDGLLMAVECCYGLDRLDREDVPLCSLSTKLSPDERAATGYSNQQVFFLQAVYDAHQQRVDSDWEYNLIWDSMVRLQEYTGVTQHHVNELIDDGLLSKDTDYPHRLFTVTAGGRSLLNEAHKSGIAFGDGEGDLGESSFHVAMVLLGMMLLQRNYVESPDSAATHVQAYYDIGGSSRLDAVALNDDGEVIVTFEAERLNHDIAEAVPSDYDKMGAFDPEEAIWLVESRKAAHKLLNTLNDPNEGPQRVEQTYSESTAPRDFIIDTPGLTQVYTFRDVRDMLAEDTE
ncbi:ATP-binding protein [Halomarina salina]|uniref:ATP-binding protein n=1 Tax=Halomarina salina TaxID=1872699 RepID=A0ABD5RGL2_9EURY|nr:hypothetical protein [Halomarina salina]